MSLLPRRLVVLLVALALATSGTAGVAGAMPTSQDHVQATTQQETSKQVAQANCAVEPPANQSDPESDVIGWEDGTWYTETLQVNQSDGVNASEQAAILDRTMARTEAIRCIEFNESVPVTVISRAEYREMVRNGNLTSGEMTPALRTFDNAKFEALFLIDETEDSIEVQKANRAAGVLGFYSPRDDQIFLIAEDRENLRIEERVLAHELLHAWQDQQYNLSSEELSPRQRDEGNAVAGVVEGDPRYVDWLYQQRCRSGDWNGTCLVPPAEGGQAGRLANLGVYVLKFQPYSDGPEMVRLVRTVGGWDAVNELYERPPESTEQVIHPERYRNDAPTDPNITDQTTENWTRVRPEQRPDYGSVGEAAVMSMFVYPLYDSQGEETIVSADDWLNFDEEGNVSRFDPFDYESNYSSGWDGDRLHVYESSETNETAYVWRLSWDSPQDAQQFRAGYERVLQYWGGQQVGPQTYRISEGGFEDAFYVSVDGRNVTIVNAPTVDQLDEVRTSIATAQATYNYPT